MRVAIAGAGFTGLSAALHLLKQKHSVIIYEKEAILGGLAAGFKRPGWNWSIERHYHHWFTNDKYALGLIKELGLGDDLLIPSPLTSIYYQNQSYPFNSPLDVLKFPHLSLIERLRCGIVVAFLKILPPSLAVNLEKYTAYEWLIRYFGKNIFSVLWQPLLDGKFGPLSKNVNMAWFWARIYKRTPKLAYLKGGYQHLMEKMASQIKKQGGIIKMVTPFAENNAKNFDKVIFTGPSFIFTQIFNDLPSDYKQKLISIPHLHALNMLLITDEKFLEKEYWLNINDRSFPFLAVIAHTNFVSNKYYGGRHLTWIGNYLHPNHKYLKMSKEELFKNFKPYLQKINPNFNFKRLTTNDYELFFGPFAQPVVGKNYSKIKPEFKTPIDNVYLANMDMVYPWDRGTNYAIELGYNVAKYIKNN